MESRKHTWSHLPNDTKIQWGLEKVGFLFLTGDTPTFSLSPEHLLPTHLGALNLQTGSSRQQAERKLQKPKSLKTEWVQFCPANDTVPASSAQLGIAGAFNSSNSCVWLWQASPLLLFPVQEQFPVGLAFAAPGFVLGKSERWSCQERLRDGSDVTVHHSSQCCQHGQDWEDHKMGNIQSKQQLLHLARRAQRVPKERPAEGPKQGEIVVPNACFVWLSELSNASVAVSIIKGKATFLGQGQRKTSKHKARKDFVPPTLLQLLLVKDTLKQFPRVYI